MFRKTIVAVMLLGLAACGTPVSGKPVPGPIASTAATTTTTAPSRPSAAPTTTTIQPTTTTSVSPTLPFAIDRLLKGADMAQVTGQAEYAHDLYPSIKPIPGIKGQTAEYQGYRSSIVLSAVVETTGNPQYKLWLAEAGGKDASACGITDGFCSGGKPDDIGQPYGPDTVTFMVHGVKDAGTVTARIQLFGDAKPANSVNALRELRKLVKDALSQ